MPMNISDYPPNWREITKKIREARGYTCQYCLKGRLRKNPFTTHHIDGDPMYNVDTNPALLHAACHLLFHSTFKTCKTPEVFKEICRNHQCQMKFYFDKKYEDEETGGKFTQYKIKQNYWRKKCSKSFLAENFSSLLSQLSPTSLLSKAQFPQKLRTYSLNLSQVLVRSTSQLKA